MKYLAEIDIMPHKELLDPQGKTVARNLKHIHLHGVDDVRIDKHISIQLEAATESEAKEKIETACRKLLANMIMEHYSYEIKSLS
jgi:phosphoribosylformylglycinamidine synthase subunit PurS